MMMKASHVLTETALAQGVSRRESMLDVALHPLGTSVQESTRSKASSFQECPTIGITEGLLGNTG